MFQHETIILDGGAATRSRDDDVVKLRIRPLVNHAAGIGMCHIFAAHMVDYGAAARFTSGDHNFVAQARNQSNGCGIDAGIGNALHAAAQQPDAAFDCPNCGIGAGQPEWFLCCRAC